MVAWASRSSSRLIKLLFQGAATGHRKTKYAVLVDEGVCEFAHRLLAFRFFDLNGLVYNIRVSYYAFLCTSPGLGANHTSSRLRYCADLIRNHRCSHIYFVTDFLRNVRAVSHYYDYF